ncbi:MAG: ABC transporter permease, partial [Candidatus Latescibacteria bacterium]|nr:ABC transporter permease [Candidatus Latescibacterota bacterium]
MFKNYLLIAFRNLLKHKIYSGTNILGLAIGLGCCILIVLYIQDELSYDRYHTHADQIYRLMRETHRADGSTTISMGTSGALASNLSNDFSQVEEAVRVWNMGTWLQYKDKVFRQSFCLSDANILSLFTFPLTKGDPTTALKEPFPILLTEAMVLKFFGKEDPMGKTITVEGRYFAGEYTVTGILKDIPRNSSPTWRTGLQFDFLTSTAVLSRGIVRSPWQGWNRGTSWFPVKTYIRLSKGYPPRELEQKLPLFMAQYLGSEVQAKNTYRLQPLTRIYLYSDVDYGRPRIGGITFVYLLGIIALFILVVASINFMNLATARYTTRAKEVSMRKVAGAHGLQLIQQFLGESVFLSFLALLLAIGFVELALPAFNAFAQKDLSLLTDFQIPVFIGLFGFSLSVGLLAGIYPAFFLSSMQPIAALKGTVKTGSKGFWIRRGLVVFQFAISILLIIATAVVHRQVDYIQHKDLGFHRDHMLLMPIFAQDRESQTGSEGPLTKKYQVVKHEFLQHPQVIKASASATYGTAGGWQVGTVHAEGFGNNGVRLPILGIDED